ncbi:MAG TPA: hypothetical protein VK620_08825 [Bradyrhizobium sp.]|nr:hypothetical protein [Bradyrhizobium sp.]
MTARLAGSFLPAASSVCSGKGLRLALPGFFGFVASFAFSSARGAIAFLADDDVREVLDFTRGLFTSAFAAGFAALLAAFALLAALAPVFFVDLFAGFLAGFLVGAVLASFFFLADFFADFFVFFEVFFAISACFCGTSPPPNANPGSSQKAFDVRSARSGRSFRR